jgi:hypothetical protein
MAVADGVLRALNQQMTAASLTATPAVHPHPNVQQQQQPDQAAQQVARSFVWFEWVG